MTDNFIEGTVTEDGQAVADAIVAAIRQEDASNLSQSQATTLDAIAKLTDANGEYRFSEEELYNNVNKYHVVAHKNSGTPRRGQENYPFVDATGPAIPDSVVDNFEDGNISEYSGATGSFSVVQDRSYEGSNALYSSVGSSQTITASTSSGLPRTPERGERFRFAFYIGSDGRDVRLEWAGSDYIIWMRGSGWSGSGNDFELLGPGSTVLDEVSGGNYTKPVNEWGVVEVDFSDPIVADLYFASDYPSGSPEVSVSASDNTTDSGDITWYANGSTTRDQWYDAFYTE